MCISVPPGVLQLVAISRGPWAPPGHPLGCAAALSPALSCLCSPVWFQSRFPACCETLPQHQDQPEPPGAAPASLFPCWEVGLCLAQMGCVPIPAEGLVVPSRSPLSHCDMNPSRARTGCCDAPGNPDLSLLFCTLISPFPLKFCPWPAALLPLLGFSSRGGCSLTKAALFP